MDGDSIRSEVAFRFSRSSGPGGQHAQKSSTRVEALLDVEASEGLTEAERGRVLFNGRARCATCHVPPLFTEPGWNTHPATDIGIDDFQASRSPDHTYRTAPLKGLWAHQKGGFYHDGRFATLMDVVNHYDSFKRLALTAEEKRDLVQFLLSL